MAAVMRASAIDRHRGDTGGPSRVPACASAPALLRQAQRGLAAADWEIDAPDRFAKAYLAALRAAAAMLTLRGRAHRGRSRPASAWMLLSKTAPELGEWAALFASASPANAAVQAGITGRVTTRDADELTRQAVQFVSLVERATRAGR